MKSFKSILYPFSFIYGVFISGRNMLFDLRILRSRKFPIWVISIGNLSMGGTGKSPHTEYIARLMERLTRTKYVNLDLTFDKIAVLSRGYKRVTSGFLLVNKTSNAREVGDEPMQMKKRLNESYVGVDGNRVRGIHVLLSLNPQIRMVLLDDAYQHRYVRPDFSILLTNYNCPYYTDSMLPGGTLREPRGGYRRAKFIIVTNVPVNITDVEKKLILKNINPRPEQKLFFSSIAYNSLVPVFKVDYTAPLIDKNYSVVLFTGIGNSHSLYNHMAEIARDVVHVTFPDHHMFKSNDIMKVLSAYNNISNPNKVIITTEKDSVRLQLGELMKAFGTAPVFYLPIEVKVHEEQEFEDAIISNLSPLNPNKPIIKRAS